ncbi:MAG: S8 family serine peptidase [Acidimicrobiia bacterium]|nr:S8 family serine peptidase [Acidimicrobiia bacterium]
MPELDQYPNEIIAGSGEDTAVLVRQPNVALVGYLTEKTEEEFKDFAGPGFRPAEGTPFLGRVGSLTTLAGFASLDTDTPEALEDLIGSVDDVRFASPAYVASDGDPRLVAPVPGLVVVGFTNDATEDDREAVAEAAAASGFEQDPTDLDLIAAIRLVSGFDDDLPTGEPAAAMLLRDRLEHMPGVAFAEIDWLVINPQRPGITKGVVLEFELPAGLMPHPRGPAAAMLDGGFDLNHPALTFEPGHDVLDPSSTVGVGDTKDPHGTACAGILAATPRTASNGQPGSVGVAPGARLIPIRVYSANPTSLSDSSKLAAGITAALQRDAKVISISLAGYKPSAALNGAIEKAEMAGVVIVAGSGNLELAEVTNGQTLINNGQEPSAPMCDLQYPARYGKVLAVGAATTLSDGSISRVKWEHTKNRNNPWLSHYGNNLDLVAPGIGIFTTDPVPGTSYTPGEYFKDFEGTSASTPYVAGIALLVRQAFPNESAAEIRGRILRSCHLPGTYVATLRIIPEHSGDWHPEVGFGVPDVQAAVAP